MGQILDTLFSGKRNEMAVVPAEYNFPKVELHLHFDGAVRHSTLLELAKAKNIDLKGATTVEEVKQVLCTHQPANLAHVLEAFDLFLPVIRGDASAIERVAYELCEDQAKCGVVYFEGRYSPHLLCDEKSPLTPQGVVEAVKRGFDRGETDFKVKARSILCCIRMHENFNIEVLELATNCKHLGIVSIDVAGCSKGADEQYEDSVIRVFEEAAKRGIHRTVHAGESGSYREVVLAVDKMHAERIGHGYRLTESETDYKTYAIEKQVHFEACPYSSVMTGAVPLNWPAHPIARFARDNINFSLSTDDPTCFDNNVVSELRIAQHEIGLTTHQLWKCQLNAAQSCFLPPDEKAEIVELIKKAEPPQA